MKVKFNERSQKLNLELDEKDFYDAIQIEEMITGNYQCRKCGDHFFSKGWEIIQGYFKSARELIIESGKQGTYSRGKRELSDMKFAKLDGFDYAANLPNLVILQANMIREANSKKEDIRNATD